jgi:hypothetical protein
MTNKLHQTRFWQNYHLYTPLVSACSMRYTVDAYLYFTIVKKFQCKNILEIGFFEGQTCGLLLESGDAHITCVDPYPTTNLFDQLYKDLQHRVDLQVIKSQDFSFKNYDLIIVDGDKNFKPVSQDIQQSINALDPAGMLLINEYQQPSVIQAIEEFVLPAQLVPFLKSDQTLFFHRSTVDRGDFLDFELPHLANNFIQFENIESWGHTILNARTLPIFSDRLDFFDLALKEFDL